MGGHGGLNILPQKRWNVYNYENREKVRRDEEAAAREEQLNREQSRRRDFEFRLERLRQARGLSSSSASAVAAAAAAADTPSSDSRHINLFDGLADFSSLGSAQEESNKYRKDEAEDGGSKKSKKKKREERPPAVSPEDEKYKLGYGLAGKGVKAPWYLSRSSSLLSEDVDEGIEGWSSSASVDGSGKKNGGKRTIEELREERMRREKQEKERERALLASATKKGTDRGFSRRHLRNES
ncbi:leukocyte receptor cluster member 1 [Phoenix dactylifera]|uniref:Leukocyte receptor cluster member 1 n=1 Tax=Phoenix dactylifera TaxID=42345 RepID=A0A8B7BWU2_PHODC|nr:leukocyte receptor cluster member 1 [Phoenix dactylifera]